MVCRASSSSEERMFIPTFLHVCHLIDSFVGLKGLIKLITWLLELSSVVSPAETPGFYLILFFFGSSHRAHSPPAVCFPSPRQLTLAVLTQLCYCMDIFNFHLLNPASEISQPC